MTDVDAGLGLVGLMIALALGLLCARRLISPTRFAQGLGGLSIGLLLVRVGAGAPHG